MRYCCSDLHGCFDEFMKLLNKLNFSASDTMYILGDNTDRGPRPVELLKYIYDHDNIISLMGNHEEFLLDYMDNNFKSSDIDLWDRNGGSITRTAIDKLNKDDPLLCRNIIDDIKNWVYCLVFEHYILSHSGYNGMKLKNGPAPIEALGKMTHEEFTWSREDFFKNKGIDDYITIFGHTPTRHIRSTLSQKKSDDIWVCSKYNDKIGIDGAIAFNGQLNCINLDEMEVIIIESK